MSARNRIQADPVSVALGKSVESAIALSGIPFAEACSAVSLSPKRMRRRLSGGTPFLCVEIVQLATLFNVPVSGLLADSFDVAVSS